MKARSSDRAIQRRLRDSGIASGMPLEALSPGVWTVGITADHGMNSGGLITRGLAPCWG
jgi:hypothetical protein